MQPWFKGHSPGQAGYGIIPAACLAGVTGEIEVDEGDLGEGYQCITQYLFCCVDADRASCGVGELDGNTRVVGFPCAQCAGKGNSFRPITFLDEQTKKHPLAGQGCAIPFPDFVEFGAGLFPHPEIEKAVAALQVPPGLWCRLIFAGKGRGHGARPTSVFPCDPRVA